MNLEKRKSLEAKLDKALAYIEEIRQGMADLDAKEKEAAKLAAEMPGLSEIRKIEDNYLIRNHYMNGKNDAESYLNLLIFAYLLLKPNSKKLEDGARFIERIRKAVDLSAKLELLLSQQISGENVDLAKWIEDIKTAGASAVLAVDIILLFDQMKAGDKGLEAISRLFSAANYTEDMISEALEAAKWIENGEPEKLPVNAKNWAIVDKNTFTGYFPEEKYNDLLYRAKKLFIQDRRREAFPLFKILSENGNSESMYFMGEYYRFAWAGLEANESLGFEYHHKGADLGNALCKLNCAYEYEKGSTDRENILSKALPKVKILAEAGDVVAQDEYGDACHSLGENEEAVWWKKTSAENGYWRALTTLVGYLGNDNIKKIYDKIYEDPGEAANIYGNRYYNENKFEEAVEWYRKGISNGNDWAMCNLGNMYRNGKGVPQNNQKAKEWYKKAYDQDGDAAGAAANNYGIRCYKDGDYEGSSEWFRKGADKGNDWAMYNLADSYCKGEGVAEDADKAKEWLQKAIACHGGAEEDAKKLLAEL